MYTLNQSPAYKRFVRDRDRALEVLLFRAQQQVSDILRGAFGHALHTAKMHYHRLIHDPSSENAESLGRDINFVFTYAKMEICHVIKRLRRTTLTLAKASEAEVLAQVLGRPITAKVSRDETRAAANCPAPEGGDLEHRVGLYLDRIRRDLVNNAQQAAMIKHDDKPIDEDSFLRRVFLAFPKARPIRKPKVELRAPKLKEAVGFKKRDEEIQFTKDSAIDMIDEDQWLEMLSDYQTAYVPQWRGPKDIIKVPGNPKQDLYAWELENTITQDFVEQVRAGQVAAAEENGITDFVWIAIIDSVTDDCCKWRDGLLTSEIEEQLKTTRKDDECQVTVPPGHFNCRCTLAPATKDLPAQPNDLSKEFEDWLNN